MPGINRIPELTDPGKILGFVQEFGEMFRDLGDLGMAPIHSRITSVADPDKVSVMAHSLRQVPGGSLILGIVE